MTTDDINLQRRRDGAFFEDWSPWRILGGHQWERHGLYRVRSGQASYHCMLMERLPYDGRPGFDLTAPGRSDIFELMRSVPGAYKPKIGKGSIGIFTRWYVPAESWRELRAVLPDIARITQAVYGAP